MVTIKLKDNYIAPFSTNYNHTCTNIEQILLYIKSIFVIKSLKSGFFFFYEQISCRIRQTMLKASLAQQELKFTS